MRFVPSRSGLLVPRKQRGFITCGPAFYAQSSSAGDPYWANVVSLLHFDGTSGSTTFTDEVSGVTWTAHGNAQISTAQSKFGGAAGLFDGNNDYLTASNSNFNLGTGDLTIEFFIYCNGNTVSGGDSCMFDARTAEPSTQILLSRADGSNPKVPYLYVNGANRINAGGAGNAIGTGVWQHVALSRSSGISKLFLDGVQQASNYTDSNNYSSTSWTIAGRFAATGGDFRSVNGYLDEFRVTKGVARYTANFTPPSGPFPNHT